MVWEECGDWVATSEELSAMDWLLDLRIENVSSMVQCPNDYTSPIEKDPDRLSGQTMVCAFSGFYCRSWYALSAS